MEGPRPSLDEAKKASVKGRWTETPLEKAARRLCNIVRMAWMGGCLLYLNGIHEVEISVSDVRVRTP
ncbi:MULTISPECIES: hypothetical protein [Pyrobaculum]|uniref:PaREP8 n=3 Tax=Pyrobaculum TaxID=2276 RepID=A4WIK4_PYRAR|nr:hypothetical protein [Pyrobaculum arsenaticum]ABP50221.1 paREP8 [Pyrobaculum arsenaticum DSM 13514]AFA39749.1 paREP8 [Pyrobaculum oguniense TE7]MCY0889884.1 hypothetical protein [Pyrobaculum arsenaticum]NYR14842.1 hypothetical protein [Pyrobaculum arsenaticum]